MRKRFAPIGLAAGLVLSACGRQRLAYTPNAPVVANGPRYPIRVGIMPLRDLTSYGPEPTDQSLVELTLEGDEDCPRLSSDDLTLDLAREISESGLVASARLVSDQWQAARQGDKLLIVGQIEDASDSDAGTGKKSLNLTVEIRVLMRFDPMETFNDQVWEQVFQQKVTTSAPLSAQAAQDALRRLYAQVVKSLSQALTEQVNFARRTSKVPAIANPSLPAL